MTPATLRSFAYSASPRPEPSPITPAQPPITPRPFDPAAFHDEVYREVLWSLESHKAIDLWQSVREPWPEHADREVPREPVHFEDVDTAEVNPEPPCNPHLGQLAHDLRAGRYPTQASLSRHFQQEHDQQWLRRIRAALVQAHVIMSKEWPTFFSGNKKSSHYKGRGTGFGKKIRWGISGQIFWRVDGILRN